MSWRSDFSVQIPVFDAHHRRLIDYLNQLHSAMLEGMAKAQLGEILAGLIDYTRMHFAAEEESMRAAQYPELPRHKQEHDRLTAEVLEFNTKFRAGSASCSVALIQFLRKWLQEHILASDRKYGEFVARGRAA